MSILFKRYVVFSFCFFFFQAEDGIRDLTVTGVQTCALPIFELAQELDKRAGGAAPGEKQRVLLQVNVAGEAQKSGCAPDETSVVGHRIAAQPHLALEGLMTIAPFTDDQDVQRRTFRALRVLRDALQEEGLWLPTLSMGMSADYGVAVEEGATVIRLGTVLFGPRERATT